MLKTVCVECRVCRDIGASSSINYVYREYLEHIVAACIAVILENRLLFGYIAQKKKKNV